MTSHQFNDNNNLILRESCIVFTVTVVVFVFAVETKRKWRIFKALLKLWCCSHNVIHQTSERVMISGWLPFLTLHFLRHKFHCFSRFYFTFSCSLGLSLHVAFVVTLRSMKRHYAYSFALFVTPPQYEQYHRYFCKYNNGTLTVSLIFYSSSAKYEYSDLPLQNFPFFCSCIISIIYVLHWWNFRGITTYAD